MAVGLVLLLLEGPVVELLEAEGAHKMLRVEPPGHGCDAAARDWLLAVGAERAAPLVVVHLAVGLSVVLEEAAIDEGRGALLHTHTHSRSGVNVLDLEVAVVLQSASGAAADGWRVQVQGTNFQGIVWRSQCLARRTFQNH